MKTLLVSAWLGLFVCLGICNAQQEFRFHLYRAEAYLASGNDDWFLSTNRCSKLPAWHPEKKDPPLSVKKAIRIAKSWLVKKGLGGGQIELILLRPVNRTDDGPYRSTFFYVIEFGVAPYGNHVTCVVLMDGTVLEPERVGESATTHS